MSRPRGFAPWRPQAKTRVLLDQIEAVLDEYAAYLPLTVRQIFYRLVGAHDYDKTEQAYDRLAETLNRARRAELVAFDAIRDDGLTMIAPYSFTGLPDFWSDVRTTARRYRLDRLADQDHDLEVWVEAAGMAPQIAAAVNEYGVPVFSSGGFDSTTIKYDAAERIADRDRPTVVLHIGDFDPSGLALFNAVAEDVAAFVAGMGGAEPAFERIAVTPAQIAAYDLPGKPPKATDRRGVWRDGDDTVQAEALPPDVLAAEVRQAVESRLDPHVLAALIATEEREREELLRRLEEMSA